MAAITALYAALLAMLLVVLSGRVMWLRYRLHVGIGDGGDKRLARWIRAQANFVEYVPIALLLLLLLELHGVAPAGLHLLGGALLLGRVLHGIGLSRHAGSSLGRLTGTGLTVLVLLVAASWLLLRGFGLTP